jgi:hypothetical protein
MISIIIELLEIELKSCSVQRRMLVTGVERDLMGQF